jgi:hypothetical protein
MNTWYITNTALPAEPWLLVLDNAEDTQALQMLISDYWVHSHSGAILITSRHPVFATSTFAGNGCLLPPLDETHAVEMLKTQIPTDVYGSRGEEEALKIVKNVNCLPIGIQVAIGTINENRCSLEQYNQGWTKPADLIQEAGAHRVHRNFAPYPTPIAHVYQDSLAKLDPESRTMIRMFALLDPDKIQEEELFDRFQDKGPAFLMKVAQKRIKCHGALSSRTLIGATTHSDGGRQTSVNIHRLLQGFLQTQISSEGVDAVQTALLGAVVVISAAMTHVWESNWPKVRKEFIEIFPHVQAINRFFCDIIIENGIDVQMPLELIQMIHKGAS